MDNMQRLTSFWRRLRERHRPRPIATTDELTTFLEQRAALIAQKCAIDYCRGKTGLASHALFTEEPFLKALEICRWETFVVVLGDLLIIAEGHLRAHAGVAQRARLGEALLAMYSGVLARQPAPSHRPEGWGEVTAAFTVRLHAAGEGGPKSALDVADHSARRLFDTLPIHASMRALDKEVVYGAVRFRMIAVSQEMQRRMQGAELIGQLLAAETQKVTL
jgi:hypothetical protein